MVRLIAVLVSLTLACYPAQAVAPAVLIAKEIVKQIIFDFVEARIEDSIRASFGPCKADLAEDAVKTSRTLTGLLRSSGGSGLSNVGALGNVGSLGSVGGAVSGTARAARNLQNVQSTADSVSSAAHLVGAAGGGDGATAIANVAGAVAGTAGTAAGVAGSAGSITGAAGAAGALGAVPGMDGMGALGGLGGQAIGPDAMAAMSRMMPSGAAMQGMGGADMQQAMAMMQQMMNAKPLDAAEINELALILESFGKISEAIQPGSACSADDYRRQFMRMTAMSAQPGLGAQSSAMVGGVLRMMYTSFKDMQRSTAEAEKLFAQMNAEDRAEYVQTTLAEMKDQPPEGRRAFLAMIDAGMLGMPDDMKAAFRKQLAT
ncbi:MAG: hypothetical protein ACXW16_05130 [Burkholderiaceae bacterium]